MARPKVRSSVLARQATELYQPGAPLHSYAPGALAKATPAKRGQKLKQTPKGLTPNAPLSAATVLRGGR